MNHARSDDRSGIGRAGDGLSADERLEVDGLAGDAGDAERFLKLLPVACIGQEKSRSLGALLLQSLQDENAAAAVAERQERDGGVVLTGAAGECQPVVVLLLPSPGMDILKELEAFADYALAFLKIEFGLEVRDPGVGAWLPTKTKVPSSRSLGRNSRAERMASRSRELPLNRRSVSTTTRSAYEVSSEPERYLITRASRAVG